MTSNFYEWYIHAVVCQTSAWRRLVRRHWRLRGICSLGLSRGVSSSFDIRGELAEIMKLRKHSSFWNFLFFIRIISYLFSAEEYMYIFLFKTFILPPIGICHPGRTHHTPQPSISTHLKISAWQNTRRHKAEDYNMAFAVMKKFGLVISFFL